MNDHLYILLTDSSVFGEWPFVCAIFMKVGEAENFLAGASLIAPGLSLFYVATIQKDRPFY